MLGGEVGMGLLTVPADADDLHVPLFKSNVRACKGTCLPGASGRVILWIEIQYHLPAKKRRQAHFLSVLIF